MAQMTDPMRTGPSRTLMAVQSNEERMDAGFAPADALANGPLKHRSCAPASAYRIPCTHAAVIPSRTNSITRSEDDILRRVRSRYDQDMLDCRPTSGAAC